MEFVVIGVIAVVVFVAAIRAFGRPQTTGFYGGPAVQNDVFIVDSPVIDVGGPFYDQGPDATCDPGPGFVDNGAFSSAAPDAGGFDPGSFDSGGSSDSGSSDFGS